MSPSEFDDQGACRLFRHIPTATPVEWREQHDIHGGYETRPWTHPSGNGVVLVCKCGAMFVALKEDIEGMGEGES